MRILIKITTIIFLLIPIISFKLLADDCKKPTMPSNDEWLTWIGEMKLLALKEGISQQTVDKELNNILPQSKIIMRDRCQVESQISLDTYLYYRIDKARIVGGKNIMKKYQKELNLIGKTFGIQPRFLAAILGFESYYGKNMGKIPIVEAISTLAFDRRRSDFYKKQLMAALKIIDNDMVISENFVGSWGGAMGMPQMIPTTFLDTGYDWNRDGKIDIWNNFEDTFASIANYLTTIDKNPWTQNITWGREIKVPNNFNEIIQSIKQKNPKGCSAVRSRSVPKSLDEWQKLGFRTINGEDLPKTTKNLEARIVAPDGEDGRVFLVYSNYKNILYYNCSSYYAVAVGLLSDAIKN